MRKEMAFGHAEFQCLLMAKENNSEKANSRQKEQLKSGENDEKGYDIDVYSEHVTDTNLHKERDVEVWFWISKESLNQDSTDSYDFEQGYLDYKKLTKKKSTKTETKTTDKWNSETTKVTDTSRIATYETVFKEELNNAVSGLKYPINMHCRSQTIVYTLNGLMGTMYQLRTKRDKTLDRTQK